MSELRQDLVSGDWIIMSPDRAKRPHDLLRKAKRIPSPLRACPFEDLGRSGNTPLRARHPARGKWQIAVIRNRYPAVRVEERCAMQMRSGPYSYIEGIGHHDLVITRSHTKHFAALSPSAAAALFELLQRMHRRFARDGCSRYVSTFTNWGPTAGASIFHPHYQLLALPIIPPDVRHSLDGSKNYFAKHHRCVHCDMLRFEREAGTRIIEANAGAVAVSPFVARRPFEVRVYPAAHFSCFETTPRSALRDVARFLQSVLRRIKRFLNDPDFNFFIHTAPLRGGGEVAHYHWHIEVFPKVSVPAGFELSTGVEINAVAPEEAAAFLRGERKVFKANV
jgi:UDPglucose--hexose-1-phosphate uridylyltransferase